MKKIYAEIGFGNDTFLSTEIEEDDNEYRMAKFMIPKKIKGIYFRFWIFKRVVILSSEKGLVFQRKDRNKLKILFGIQGTNDINN
ncbi:MAG: hypothetical protein CMH63_02705 [Nanoarchaeota archaeon]|jgi:hypothetical protein|nr:hypothetical protein [Nanoarchaeota archaeon]|tara:strand:+ start:6040 stop:6294 length:255 start_codon:yes stop_codon:yes gene_type:complete